ncbi:immunoglobulin-like domain-containing protein [Aliicoccus persicus]|uniref:Bacterial Ig-like domain-containing protein n=1 Tax=Aliicoccus persicus TaxID=930138 RepID=A0A662Z297_9STAP|nr:immunoglobulin-like domain-containing protein [Aliicoccus persicus]SEV79851.1 hypothetical protein SAMN05192557_0032 [Aliicoccus persicus]
MIKIIVLLLLATGVYGNDTDEGGEVNIEDDVVEDIDVDNEYIEVELEESVVGTDAEGITFTVINNHESSNLQGGAPYTLEYYDGEQWEDITPFDVFVMIAYIIEPGGSHEFTHIIRGEGEASLAPGDYRIIKIFSIADENGESESVEVIVPFEVVTE